MKNSKLIRFKNCRQIYNHQLIVEDVLVRDGKIINPEKVFFDEQIQPDIEIDCNNAIVAPGFIDLQINGGFGVDFSYNVDDVEAGINKVAKGLLAHGVTSFCPTLVTSTNETYKKVLPKIKRRKGDKNGATILGVHLEGPFINPEKKGAHSPELIKDFPNGLESLLETYGTLENVSIVTLAPEKTNSSEVISKLTERGIIVSLGHSNASLHVGEEAVKSGANLVTHLYNAMNPFHHRDPGLVGLIASLKVPDNQTLFFGIISDGVHTDPAALRIAHRTHPKGLILVTDAISALGLEEGVHHVGKFDIEIRKDTKKKAFIAGTETLCGSIASMDKCVRTFRKALDCCSVYSIEAASLHPAQCLGITQNKGTLNYGADADFVFLTDDLHVISTWIAGECVYSSKN